MISYSNPLEVFSILNKVGIEYLVMRNYENLAHAEMFLLDGHPDIDILCWDSQEIVRLLDVQTDRKDIPPFKGDGTHYSLRIADRQVSLDLRYVGDGYYCRTWQQDMLAHRVACDGFYVMDLRDYFYSLAYHALLQKRSFSDEYRKRLRSMADELGIACEGSDSQAFLSVLQGYMRERGYRFEYASDCTVPCRFGQVAKDMILRDKHLERVHRRFETRVALIETLVRVKHAFFG